MGDMKEGKYECVDFRSYRAPFAESHFLANIRKSPYGRGTCGTHMLQTVTGFKSKYIEDRRPNAPQLHLRGYWTDHAVKNFLQSRGFKFGTVTKKNVTSVRRQGWFGWSDWNAPLGNQHVLLCGLLMAEYEASWVIIHNRKTYHNMQVEDLNPLLLFNRPSDCVYLLWHPKWMKEAKK